MLNVFVGAVNVADVKAAPVVLIPILETYNCINKILADQAYRGRLVEALNSAYNCTFEITKKLGDGFVVAPWRWVVERTFAWIENARRLCRDYQELPEHHEGFIYVAMIRLMLSQLHGNQRKRSRRETLHTASKGCELKWP
jgi:putative transposase